MEVTDPKSFVKYARAVRRRTLDVIHKIPDEKKQWRLNDNSFSIPEIIWHIGATEWSLWGAGLSTGPSDVKDFPEGLSFNIALDFFQESRSENEKHWSSLSQEQLANKIATPAGAQIVLKRWLLLAIEHEIHHRSFIHAYRKLWGEKSHPIYGLNYEDLPLKREII